MRLRRAILGGGLAMSALSTVAHAAPATRLVYSRESGAERCADEGALRGAVAERLGYDPFFPWARTTLVASVRRDAGVYRAHIALVDGEGMVRGTRDLSDTGEECAELLGAMALGISIALDMLDPRPPEPESPAERPKPPEPPPPRVAPAPAAREEAPPVPAPPPQLRAEAGLDVSTGIGVLPAPDAGIGGFVRVRETWWSIGAEAAFDAPVSTRDRLGTETTAYAFGGALVPCAHLAWLGLCGLASIGLIHARAVDTGTAAVGSLGVRATAEVPISGRLAARLHADAMIPLARTILRADAEDLWRAPPVTGRLGLGLVYRF